LKEEREDRGSERGAQINTAAGRKGEGTSGVERLEGLFCIMVCLNTASRCDLFTR